MTREEVLKLTKNVKVICPYCKKQAVVKIGSYIHKNEERADYWYYYCESCKSYIGINISNGVPYGDLVDSDLRDARYFLSNDIDYIRSKNALFSKFYNHSNQYFMNLDWNFLDEEECKRSKAIADKTSKILKTIFALENVRNDIEEVVREIEVLKQYKEQKPTYWRYIGQQTNASSANTSRTQSNYNNYSKSTPAKTGCLTVILGVLLILIALTSFAYQTLN